MEVLPGEESRCLDGALGRGGAARREGGLEVDCGQGGSGFGKPFFGQADQETIRRYPK